MTAGTLTPVPLADAREEAEYGGKAVQLGAAIRARLPVPPGFALGARSVEAIASGDPTATGALRACFEALDGPVSVRSSGIGEDSEKTSFAGQHLTVLNVRTAEDAVRAVRDVWDSGHSETAIAYREMLGIAGEPRIGVVVQRLVEPDTAGVLFTRHPVTAAAERVIDASWGLGEAVVGGLVAPDHFRMAPDGTVLEQRAGRKDLLLRILPDGGLERVPVDAERVAELCLDEADLAALNDLASACERVYGGDQDIEWAIRSGAVALLQRRPLTAVG
jgi:pyruvate,water dikinase